ncbi:MAG TPA: immunoglobulin domain-containing protein, partial [Ferruginibacter sp.]|nr:immunoglobulin domain-containing protein [Ferruginibacter sp.]
MSNSSFDVSLRFSDNNYSSSLGGWTASTSAQNRTVNLSGNSALQNRTTPVTFRLYGTDANANSSTYRLLCEGTNQGNNRGVDVDGTVTHNPYVAEFISMNYGSSPWCQGETRDVSVTVKNVGSATWNSAEPVNIGLKWNEDTDYGAGPSFIARQPAGSVVTGQTVTYTFPNVPASTLTGNNNLTFDVVRELVCWFGNNSGGCGPGNSTFVSPTINILAQPTAVSVSGGGTFCNSTTITASGGTGGTMYFQGTDPNGVSITTPATSQVVTESGTYYFRSRSAAGCWSVAGSATVTINKDVTITAQPQAQTICEGGTINLNVTATGTPTPTYQWKKNNINIPGETSSTFSIPSAVFADGGSYTVTVTNSCNSITSAAANVVVNMAPAVTVDPTNETVCEGSPVTFSVTATGTNLTYQWRKGGVDINGATASSYTISSVVSADAGSYDVVVSNIGCTPATSAAATLTVNTLPAITVDPVDASVCEGGSINLSVTATGTPTPTYQWKKDNIETNNTLSIPSAVLADGGSYAVEVTNTCGSDLSGAAVVVVNVAPAVTADPSDETVCEGSPVTFNVTATGTNLTYQWRKGGVDINGANGTSYTIPSTVLADAGNYDVVVSNPGCTPATSATAVLTVNARPTAAITSSSQTICSATSTTVSGNVTATGAWTLQLSDGQTTSGSGNGSFSFTVSPVNTTTYTLSTMSDVNCASSGGDLTGSVTITTNPLPAGVSVTPATATICNGGVQALLANGSTSETASTLVNNNFTAGVTTSGSTTGNRSQIFERENSGSNINSTGTFTSPNGSGMLVALSAASASGFIVTANSSANTNAIVQVSTVGYSSLNLTFNHTYTQANGGGSGVVAVSTDGVNWTNVQTYNSNQGGQASFVGASISLSNAYLNQPNLRIRFTYSATGSSTGFLTTAHAYWWAIDDVSINGTLLPLYSWTADTGPSENGLPSGASTPSATNLNIDVDPSVTTTYTLTATNPVTGCISTATSVVTVNERPTAVLSGGATYCNGDVTTTTLTLNVTGSGTISGTLSDNTPFSGTAPTITVDVTPSSSTTYTIATLADANCTAIGADISGSATVTINDRPTAVLSGGATYCENENSTTTLTLTVTGSGTISGTLSDNTPFSGTAPTITVNVSPFETTVYTIATLADANCSAIAQDLSGTATIIVNPLIPVSVVIESSDPDNEICDGTSVTFTATPGNGGNASYQWLLNGNPVGTDQNTYTTSTLVDGDQVSVVLTSDVTPCATGNPATSNVITTTVNALQPVSVTISSSDADNTICDGESVTFTATPVNGGVSPSYQWLLNGNPVGSDQDTYTTSTLADGDVVSVVLTS